MSSVSASEPAPADDGSAAGVIRRALHPPLHDRGFWGVQAVVVLLAGLHFLIDLRSSAEGGSFPGGIPVALLIVPVGYAALRWGLSGSALTAAFATVLWLPDLLLPVDKGHAPSDVVNLVLVDAVALVFGQRIEAERRAHARVEQATLARLYAEAGFRQLFEANRAPILVVDAAGNVRGANPAATAAFGEGTLGARASALAGSDAPVETLHGQVVSAHDGHDYRVAYVTLPEGGDSAAQLVFEDVTEERSQSRRAAQRRARMIAAEEEQRRRLARELHDELLQLLLHLARKLEALRESPGMLPDVLSSLDDARVRSLQAATRLRALARDLRPPSLDHLGLVAALSGFLAEVEEESGLPVELTVAGAARRLAPDVELGVFRIVQEAVRNAVGHGRPRRVDVTVELGAERLEVRVSDDGAGFDARALQADAQSAHLGLVGMSERAGLLGGTLEVDSEPGGGTVVHASIPLSTAAGDGSGGLHEIAEARRPGTLAEADLPALPRALP